MTSEIQSRRVPFIALVLSFMAAGVGHLYCGRIAKGLPLYFAWLLVPLGITIAALNPPSTIGLLFLVLLPVIIVFGVYMYAAINAWRLARQIGSEYSLRDYNRASIYWLLIVVQMIFSIGLIAGVRHSVYEAFIIPTKSMSPTILDGDRVLARKLSSRDHFPERGDLIVFRNPTQSKAVAFAKRVVAVAGDQIEISGERVLINGNELKKDRIPDESLKHLGGEVSGQISYEENSGHRYMVAYDDAVKAGPEQREFKTTVPARHVFVLGDNRDASRDSRHFGSIHFGDIVGQIDYIYWPSESWSRFGVADARLP